MEDSCLLTLTLFDANAQVARVCQRAAKDLDLVNVVRLSGQTCFHRILQITLDSRQLIQSLLFCLKYSARKRISLCEHTLLEVQRPEIECFSVEVQRDISSFQYLLELLGHTEDDIVSVN